ncbi:T9SS_type A sorting domain-containing protein [Hexamita inflata]|uniref:T9SS type A sorting domain-containing protein n=1 Tax=Hexamita inflata TaxID=28002 RepID=A0AA86URF5_9EUKA|nr:T9SS type A sorting domain-containing protein [Hexamita inflata]
MKADLTEKMKANKTIEEKMILKYKKSIQARIWITVFRVPEKEWNQLQEMQNQIENCGNEAFGINERIECDVKDREIVLTKIKEINPELKYEMEQQFNSLCISNEPELEDLSFVNSFNIQKLNVECCKNVKFNEVANVKCLHVTYSGLKRIDGISNWTQLQELFLFENKLKNIAELENLTQLKVLSLWENRIQDLGPLRKHVNLTTLDLSENLIQSVEPLRGLTNLMNLDLQENYIKAFSPIQNHPSFSRFYGMRGQK